MKFYWGCFTLLVVAVLAVSSAAGTTTVTDQDGNDESIQSFLEERIDDPYDRAVLLDELLSNHGDNGDEIGDDNETDEEMVERLLQTSAINKCKIQCQKPQSKCKQFCFRKFNILMMRRNKSRQLAQQAQQEPRVVRGERRANDRPRSQRQQRRRGAVVRGARGAAATERRQYSPPAISNARDLKGSSKSSSKSGGSRFPGQNMINNMAATLKRRSMTMACNDRCKQKTFRCTYRCYTPKCKKECLPKVDKCLTKCNTRNALNGEQRVACRIQCYKTNKNTVNNCLKQCEKAADESSSTTDASGGTSPGSSGPQSESSTSAPS